MALVEVPLPVLGEDGPEEATVSFFAVEEGAAVKKDDKLAEVLTDKATFEVVIPADGTVKEIRVQEDETVRVGQVLVIIEVA